MLTATNFRNTKFRIDDDHVLSESTWQRGDTHYVSVGVFKRFGDVYRLNTSTCLEGKRDDETDASYLGIDFAHKIYEDLKGEKMPVRFYRDNHIERGERVKIAW